MGAAKPAEPEQSIAPRVNKAAVFITYLQKIRHYEMALETPVANAADGEELISS